MTLRIFRWFLPAWLGMVPFAAGSDAPAPSANSPVVPAPLAPAPVVPAPAPRPLPKSTTLPPPHGSPLKKELAGLVADREELKKDLPLDSTTAERAELRAQLGFLLKRLSEAPPPSMTSKSPFPAPKPKFDFPTPESVLDGMRLAQNLFRDDELDAALRAFRLLDTSKMTREDRAFVMYMTATCLRKLNKPAEASIIYREVADAKDDEYLANCAIWQLSLLKSTQELEQQLEQLRARSKPR